MQGSFLFVGLGNPGPRYEMTRHNLGFMVVEWLACEFGFQWKLKENCAIAGGVLESRELTLAKPLSYMNRCGAAVGDLFERLQIPLTNLLVILDDFNLPFGKLRLRRSGSDGGHNGLASIIESLQSPDFPRLRVGIDNATEYETIDFVLSRFETEEEEKLPDIIMNAGRACISFMNEGIDKSMNHINRNLSKD